MTRLIKFVMVDDSRCVNFTKKIDGDLTTKLAGKKKNNNISVILNQRAVKISKLTNIRITIGTYFPKPM